MELKNVLKNVQTEEIIGDVNVNITNIASDSRQIKVGGMFRWQILRKQEIKS